MALYLTFDEEANALLYARDPFALLVGMLLDQQVPMERAFSAPYALRERLGGRLDPEQIASMDPTRLQEVFAERPALHRFPSAMADRVRLLAEIIYERFGGDAAAVWTTARDGNELVANLRTLPGFGEQKAQIFTALLGKQHAIRPKGWEKAAGNYGKRGTFASIADIDGPAAFDKVRAHKREVKANAKAATPTTAKATATPSASAGRKR